MVYLVQLSGRKMIKEIVLFTFLYLQLKERVLRHFIFKLYKSPIYKVKCPYPQRYPLNYYLMVTCTENTKMKMINIQIEKHGYLNCLCWDKDNLEFTRFLYRVTHKGWDFREDCTKYILSVSLNSRFPAT